MPQPKRRARLTGKRLWIFRGLALSFPFVFLLLLEAGLRVAGYGYDTSFFVKDSSKQFLHENRKFVWRFYSPDSNLRPHPFVLPLQKPADTFRIFVLGESAALGTPDPAFGFWRMLDHQLRRDFPGKRFEIINAAMRGINSHIILPIARECAKQRPDLFIVYMGNNELVGLHAPGPESHFLSSNLTFLRTVDALKETRIGQLFASLARKFAKKPKEEQDMEFFRKHRIAADDPRRIAVYNHFERNLDELCAVISDSGAKLMLLTVPVNLKDCPPLGSLHRASLSPAETEQWQKLIETGLNALRAENAKEALAMFKSALALDDHYAELHYLIAETAHGLGETETARQHYTLARDWDALPFRADSQINGIIRKIAATRNAQLLDAEEWTGKASGGVPGASLFYEHVHFRPPGDHLIAQNIYAALVPMCGVSTQAVFAPLQTCKQRIALTPLAEGQLNASIVDLMSHPPFLDQLNHAERMSFARQNLTNQFSMIRQVDMEKAEQLCQRAIIEAPNDWHLYNAFGNFYLGARLYAKAAAQFRLACDLIPHHQVTRMSLANAQARAGAVGDAKATLRESLRIDPSFAPARQALNALGGQ